MGIYLSLMAACVLLSLKAPFLPMLITPLAIGFPAILWMLMRRIGAMQPTYMKVSSLWLAGIYTVIFGTLICMLLSGLYVVFIEPGFVVKYFETIISQVEASEFAAYYADTVALMRNAIDSHIVPSGMEFVTAMGWFTCFAGSILSLIIAFIMGKMVRKPSQISS